MTEEKKAVKYDFGLWEVGVGYDSCSGSVVRHPPRPRGSKLNSSRKHLQTRHCFIYSLASFNIFPLVIWVLSAVSHPGGPAAPPPQFEANCSSSSLCQVLFFFLWERLRNACLLHSEGLAAGCPSLPLLPWQCCTVIDKVDKEMLGHAPDRLDLKSPRWGNGSSQTAYTKSPDNQRLAEEFGSSAGSGKNVIFCRFVFFGPSCLQCCRQISAYGRFSGCEREKKWELC